MKNILFIPLLFFVSLAYCQNPIVIQPNSKLRVKQVKSFIYKDDQSRAVILKSNEAYKPRFHLDVEVLLFDSTGRLIEKRVEDSTGKIILHHIYEYDKNGNPLKTVEYVGKQKSLTTIKSYRNDTLIEKRYLDGSDRNFSTWAYEFDPGRKMKISTETANGKQDDVYHSYYDKNGLQVRDSQFNSQGQLYFYWEGSYNRNKKLVKQKSWGTDSINYVSKEYSYDKKGHLTHLKEFDKQNRLVLIMSMKYDKKGNPVLVSRSRPLSNENVTERSEYTYDNYGNWESKKTFRDYSTTELSKTLREIDYF